MAGVGVGQRVEDREVAVADVLGLLTAEPVGGVVEAEPQAPCRVCRKVVDRAWLVGSARSTVSGSYGAKSTTWSKSSPASRSHWMPASG